MLPGGILLAFFFAVLNVALSAPAETITPVNLNHRCFNPVNGKPNKSPILLIHGLADTLETWSGIMETLAIGTGRRVCAVDLRDHGDSPRTGRIDVEALATDIKHFVDKEGIKKVNIVGHSLGGKTAVHFTLNNPARVDSLVSEDMRPNFDTKVIKDRWDEMWELTKGSINSVPEGVSEEEAKKAILKFYRKKFAEWGVKEEVDESAVKHLRLRQVNGRWEWKMNLDALEKAVQDLDSFLTKSTGVYKGPTMFIYGTKSLADVGGDRENIMKLFPNAKLVPVDAEHYIHVEKRRQFTDEVIKMINGID